jgi:CubicO group peptidase (beta-lactamase class C family)
VPVTTATVFEAASMSKPILALVAIQLIQEGRLDLDRPLVDYLGHDYLPDQPEQPSGWTRISPMLEVLVVAMLRPAYIRG